MDDLVAFLRARLDEDEATAKAALEGGDGHWTLRDHPAESVMVWDNLGRAVVYNEGAPGDAEAAHIARHDPARVLREVEAKRSIIDGYEIMAGVVERAEQDGIDTSGVAITRGERDALRDAMQRLAAVYSDHPDYRPGWRQDG